MIPVGIDVKLNPDRAANIKSLLLLCVGTRCLVFKMSHYFSLPSSVGEFLGDKTICYVGTEMSAKFIREDQSGLLKSVNGKTHKAAVGIGHIAARVLKDSRLEKCGLAELAVKVGLNFGNDQNQITQVIPWNDVVFSKMKSSMLFMMFTDLMLLDISS
ncbi:Werner Syndrome-like exonuclease-like protein [Corchorus olitorius]|uniref:Werner Syndrome-like exonuclease-like protein n=1 Tax=Corchorus olitorius TaxID=93759 RepID=A0A1R3JZ06_9ROSI|nr:Werner Syndrome-like exonuclease-like protein [Corchorus olitorius]